MDDIDFGVYLVPEGNSYTTLRKEALLSEEMGYNSIWISDHLLGMYGDPGASRLECWTVSTALGVKTEEVKIGQITMATPFRNPALLAKMSSTLDVITEGRVILSLGAGWHENEFNAYGYRYGTWRDRIGMLGEAAKIIKKMWMEESPTFRGRHYQIEKAYCSPKPVQKPHPDLMIAGGGEKLTLRVVAEHGDISNFVPWVGTPSQFSEKSVILDHHCEDVGRNPEEIKRSWAAFVFISEDYKEAEEAAKRAYKGSDRDPAINGLVGTPGMIIDQLRSFIDEGASLFILSFLGGDWEKEAELFSRKVMSEFA